MDSVESDAVRIAFPSQSDPIKYFHETALIKLRALELRFHPNLILSSTSTEGTGDHGDDPGRRFHPNLILSSTSTARHRGRGGEEELFPSQSDPIKYFHEMTK